jgi:hypothetical protein
LKGLNDGHKFARNRTHLCLRPLRGCTGMKLKRFSRILAVKKGNPYCRNDIEDIRSYSAGRIESTTGESDGSGLCLHRRN